MARKESNSSSFSEDFKNYRDAFCRLSGDYRRLHSLAEAIYRRADGLDAILYPSNSRQHYRPGRYVTPNAANVHIEREDYRPRREAANSRVDSSYYRRKKAGADDECDPKELAKENQRLRNQRPLNRAQLMENECMQECCEALRARQMDYRQNYEGRRKVDSRSPSGSSESLKSDNDKKKDQNLFSCFSCSKSKGSQKSHSKGSQSSYESRKSRRQKGDKKDQNTFTCFNCSKSKESQRSQPQKGDKKDQNFFSCFKSKESQKKRSPSRSPSKTNESKNVKKEKSPRKRSLCNWGRKKSSKESIRNEQKKPKSDADPENRSRYWQWCKCQQKKSDKKHSPDRSKSKESQKIDKDVKAEKKSKKWLCCGNSPKRKREKLANEDNDKELKDTPTTKESKYLERKKSGCCSCCFWKKKSQSSDLVIIEDSPTEKDNLYIEFYPSKGMSETSLQSESPGRPGEYVQKVTFYPCTCSKTSMSDRNPTMKQSQNSLWSSKAMAEANERWKASCREMDNAELEVEQSISLMHGSRVTRNEFPNCDSTSCSYKQACTVETCPLHQTRIDGTNSLKGPYYSRDKNVQDNISKVRPCSNTSCPYMEKSNRVTPSSEACTVATCPLHQTRKDDTNSFKGTYYSFDKHFQDDANSKVRPCTNTSCPYVEKSNRVKPYSPVSRAIPKTSSSEKKYTTLRKPDTSPKGGSPRSMSPKTRKPDTSPKGGSPRSMSPKTRQPDTSPKGGSPRSMSPKTHSSEKKPLSSKMKAVSPSSTGPQSSEKTLKTYRLKSKTSREGQSSTSLITEGKESEYETSDDETAVSPRSHSKASERSRNNKKKKASRNNSAARKTSKKDAKEKGGSKNKSKKPKEQISDGSIKPKTKKLPQRDSSPPANKYDHHVSYTKSSDNIRSAASDDSRIPASEDSRGPASNDSRRPASNDSRRPASNDSRRSASDDSRRPASNDSRRPASKDSRRPAPEKTHEDIKGKSVPHLKMNLAHTESARKLQRSTSVLSPKYPTKWPSDLLVTPSRLKVESESVHDLRLSKSQMSVFSDLDVELDQHDGDHEGEKVFEITSYVSPTSLLQDHSHTYDPGHTYSENSLDSMHYIGQHTTDSRLLTKVRISHRKKTSSTRLRMHADDSGHGADCEDFSSKCHCGMMPSGKRSFVHILSSESEVSQDLLNHWMKSCPCLSEMDQEDFKNRYNELLNTMNGEPNERSTTDGGPECPAKYFDPATSSRTCSCESRKRQATTQEGFDITIDDLPFKGTSIPTSEVNLCQCLRRMYGKYSEGKTDETTWNENAKPSKGKCTCSCATSIDPDYFNRTSQRAAMPYAEAYKSNGLCEDMDVCNRCREISDDSLMGPCGVKSCPCLKNLDKDSFGQYCDEVIEAMAISPGAAPSGHRKRRHQSERKRKPKLSPEQWKKYRESRWVMVPIQSKPKLRPLIPCFKYPCEQLSNCCTVPCGTYQCGYGYWGCF